METAWPGEGEVDFEMPMQIWKPAALAILLLLVLAPGCSTPNAGSRTLKQVDMDVSWPMTRFRNAVAAGAVTTAERDRVNTAFASYHAAYAKALENADNNREAAAPDALKALADQVIEAISAIPF